MTYTFIFVYVFIIYVFIQGALNVASIIQIKQQVKRVRRLSKIYDSMSKQYLLAVKTLALVCNTTYDTNAQQAIKSCLDTLMTEVRKSENKETVEEFIDEVQGEVEYFTEYETNRYNSILARNKVLLKLLRKIKHSLPG